jgi:hypothetical protein
MATTGILPTGLTESDLPFGSSGSLLDYTPPNVQWQAPLAPKGGNVFANYVKSYPDLLSTYNRRLSRPEGTFEALPHYEHIPQTMADWGAEHYLNLGQAAGRDLYRPMTPWSDPGRSPYVPYGGRQPWLTSAGVNTTSGEGDEGTSPVHTPVPSQIGGQELPELPEAVTQEDVSSINPTNPLGTSPGWTPGIFDDPNVVGKAEWGGHDNFSDWYMDPRNQFGHYWALSNSAWTNPDTGVTMGPQWNFAMGMWI